MIKILTNKIIPKLIELVAIKDTGWLDLPLADGVAGDGVKYRKLAFPWGGGLFTWKAI